jgi:hypothetical protein
LRQQAVALARVPKNASTITPAKHASKSEGRQSAFTFCGLLLNAQHGFEMDAVFLGMLCTNNSAKGIKTQLIKESTSQKPKPESQKTGESVATMNNPMANRSVPKILCAQRNGNSLNSKEALKMTMALQKVALPPLLPC